MANYSRYKIRFYPVAGQLNPVDFTNRVTQLKAADKIYETLELFYPADLTFGEAHFTMKWFPESLEEIFPTDKFDVWTIHSDEGGAADLIRFESGSQNKSTEEKALYTCDTFYLEGTKDVGSKLPEIFGPGINRFKPMETPKGLMINLGCIYSNCNFLYNSRAGEIQVNPPAQVLSDRGELEQMRFEAKDIDLKKHFYDPADIERSYENKFPYLQKIEFHYKGRLTNRIEWRLSDLESNKDQNVYYWQHNAGDGFWNCVNNEFTAYETMRKMQNS